MEKRNKLFVARFGSIEEMRLLCDPATVFPHDACRYSAIIRNMRIYVDTINNIGFRNSSIKVQELNKRLPKIGCGCTGCKDASGNMIHIFVTFIKVLGKNYAKMG